MSFLFSLLSHVNVMLLISNVDFLMWLTCIDDLNATGDLANTSGPTGSTCMNI